jgi:hypothetical protein
MIFSSQQRHDQGILKHPLHKLRRAPAYREILEYSYKDYFEKFATPYFRSRGIDLTAPEALEKPVICERIPRFSGPTRTSG